MWPFNNKDRLSDRLIKAYGRLFNGMRSIMEVKTQAEARELALFCASFIANFIWMVRAQAGRGEGLFEGADRFRDVVLAALEKIDGETKEALSADDDGRFDEYQGLIMEAFSGETDMWTFQAICGVLKNRMAGRDPQSPMPFDMVGGTQIGVLLATTAADVKRIVR